MKKFSIYLLTLILLFTSIGSHAAADTDDAVWDEPSEEAEAELITKPEDEEEPELVLSLEDEEIYVGESTMITAELLGIDLKDIQFILPDEDEKAEQDLEQEQEDTEDPVPEDVKNDDELEVICTYESSDEKVAEVDDDGNITGIKSGQALIKAVTEFYNEHGDKIKLEEEKHIQILAAPDPVVVSANISIPTEDITLTVGETQTIKPASMEDIESITYTSSNNAVATVDPAGKVKAVAKGTAQITVVITPVNNGAAITETIKVTVNNPGLIVSTNKGNAFTLLIDKTDTITPNINKPMKVQTVSYKNSNTAVAAVDNTGKITAHKNGTAVITVNVTADDGQKGSCQVTVTVPSVSVEINHPRPSIKTGNSIQLVPKLQNSIYKIKAKTYHNSNSKVASMTKAGTVKGLKKGTTTVTIKTTTTDNRTFTNKVKVTVVDKVNKDTTYITSATNVRFAKSNKYQVKPTLKNSTSYITSTKYKISNKKIATITSAGTVKGKKAGKVTVTITSKTRDKQTLVKKVTLIIQTKITKSTPYITVSGSKKVKAGASAQLKPKLRNSRSSIKSSAYKSSNKGIVSVSKTGKITGKRAGTATITVTSKSKTNHVLTKKVTVVVAGSTIKNYLRSSMRPVGSTMYIWGGGWNTKSSSTIGVSSQWKKYFKKQTSSYNYKKTRWQSKNGLDCSGYVGWSIYQIMQSKSNRTSYVMKSTSMAKNYSKRGWGSYKTKSKVKNFKAGDIMSTNGHVYIVVGQCRDGSIVLMHASPPGVQLSGTYTPKGNENSEAIQLATQYMKKYFPAWYKKYPNNARGTSYLKNYNQMRWNVTGKKVMSDPDKYHSKYADEILKDLLGKL